MNLFKLYNKPEEMAGYENRFRVPSIAYDWCLKYGRNKGHEKHIATDPELAYLYARDVIKGPWPEAGIHEL
jgi:hypothetical protein